MEFELPSVIFNDKEIQLVKQNADFGFDIHHVKVPELKCSVLFTAGLSQTEQRVKEGFEDFRKIELYFCLPDYMEVNGDHWSVYWLNRIAEVPAKFDTWFGMGDTVPAGNPPEVIFEPFEANHFMLTPPMLMNDFFNHDQIQQKGIQFMAIVPISQDELDYKLRNSWSVLLKRLQKKRFTEKVDNFRTSVCRKRWF
jgi:hypothetical protein